MHIQISITCKETTDTKKTLISAINQIDSFKEKVLHPCILLHLQILRGTEDNDFYIATLVRFLISFRHTVH